MAQREAAILAVLGRRPGIDPAALGREVGLSGVRLSQLLKSLEQAGRVTRAHGGLFAGTGQTEPAAPDDQPPAAERDQLAEARHGDDTPEPVGEAA